MIPFMLSALLLPSYAQEDPNTLPDIVIETIPISDDVRQTEIEKFNLRVVDYDPEYYKDKWITTIDVSQGEIIAVGFNDCSVVVADKDYYVKYALHFDMENPKFYVNWNGELLEIIHYRSDYAYIISPEGALIDVEKKNSSSENYRKVSHRANDTVNRNAYSIERSNVWMFFTGDEFDMLVKTDTTGNKQVLFASEDTFPESNVILAVAIFGGLAAFAVIVLVDNERLRRQRRAAAQARLASQKTNTIIDRDPENDNSSKE
jgi:hypothetical protein